MHRDTVTRSWGPLSCHSSSSITSCFSMIMHSPMSQRSVHNSLKLKVSQFFHGLHTHMTCHALSMFGMLWRDVYTSVFQFSPISKTSHSHWKGAGQHSTINSLINSMWRRCIALHELNYGDNIKAKDTFLNSCFTQVCSNSVSDGMCSRSGKGTEKNLMSIWAWWRFGQRKEWG